MSRQGEERIVRKFLWCPRQFGYSEIRWLEFANIREVIKEEDCKFSYTYRWVETGFENE